MIAVIDNYDSFTYNIVQYLGELGAHTQVFRNDAISVESLARLKPEKLLISPGPGSPDTAGISMDAIEFFKSEIPILGVCLGHQSIGQVFGGKIIRATQIMHGKLSQVEHAGTGVFTGLQSPYTATRYHSLVIDPATLPDCLELTAWTQAEGGGSSQPKSSNTVDQAANDGAATRIEIMGVRHRELDIEGVQFHPESISSEYGHELLQNFINR